MSTGCSPRTTARVSTDPAKRAVRRPAGRAAVRRSDRLRARSPICPIRRRCRRPAAISSISTSGTARSRISSSRTWSRARSASMPPRASRRSGRCGCSPRTPAPAHLRLARRRRCPAGATLIAPSTGVLTTGTFEVAPVDDPCELPPTGGYRGLENQLYRVEIHDPGQPGGGATFKWSRENASVGSRVASMISASELELATLGRDDVLSLQDRRLGRDHRRRARVLAGARRDAQGHGRSRRRAASSSRRRCRRRCCPEAFPTAPSPRRATCGCAAGTRQGAVFRTDAERHAGPGAGSRCRRLDRRHRRAGRGHDAACWRTASRSASPRPAPRASSAGDYWVFAARTADASVELLDRAPPRGIHHHYARLGIWDVGAGTRHRLPPSLAADRRGPRLQLHRLRHRQSRTPAASSRSRTPSTRLAQTGGTVCLGPGQYALARAGAAEQRALGPHPRARPGHGARRAPARPS